MQVDQTKSYSVWYDWHPQYIAAATASTEVVSDIITGAPDAGIAEFIGATVAARLGVKDPTDAELKALVQARADQIAGKFPDIFPLNNLLGLLTSTRAWVGFTTHGHTGAPFFFNV